MFNNQRGVELHFEDARFCPIEVTEAWVISKGAGAGGYAVWYEDGFMSWSPAAAFEAGYTLVDEVSQARLEQSAAVMPLIGPLLDAWEGMSNDERGVLREEAPDLCSIMARITSGMVDEPRPAGQATQAAREVGK